MIDGSGSHANHWQIFDKGTHFLWTLVLHFRASFCDWITCCGGHEMLEIAGNRWCQIETIQTKARKSLELRESSIFLIG
jgi:hypothetical protein